MKKFAYKQVSMLGTTLIQRERMLIELGVSGWELCAIDGSLYIFKKEMQNDQCR